VELDLKRLTEPPPTDHESCYVDSTLGVISILKSVAAKGVRAKAYPDGSECGMDTMLLAIEPRPLTFLFAQSHDTATNERVRGTRNLTLVTSDHGVPVQFRCAAPAVASFRGTDVFRAPLPDRVLRLQRRDYYRLDGSPVHTLLRCTLTTGDPSPTVLRPAVMDVSCGGLALAFPTTQAVLATGSRHHCTLEIEAAGRTEVLVEVHSSRIVTLAGGGAALRIGVEFLSLDGRFESLLQRYIIDEERVRNSQRLEQGDFGN
jgi:flagellar brake protein